MDKSFRGVFVPAEICLNSKLTATEKILLAEICSLDAGEGCTKKNEYFADILGLVDIYYVSKMISKLVRLGYISRETLDGKGRVLKANPGKIGDVMGE